MADALCVGTIYWQSEFEGPLTDAERASCPAAMDSLCTMPLNDQLPERGAVAFIGLSILTAISSATFFGKEAAVRAACIDGAATRVVTPRPYSTAWPLRRARAVAWQAAARYRTWGVSMLAHTSGGMIVQSLELAALPLVFHAISGQMWGVQGSFAEHYAISLGAVWAASGLGYLIVFATASAERAQFVAAGTIIVITIFSGGTTPLPQLRAAVTDYLYPLTELSFLRFALEAEYVGEIRHYSGVYNITGALVLHGYSIDRYATCQRVVWAHGAAYRAAALALCAGLRRLPSS